MVAFDANESLTPFEHRRDGQAAGYGAILFDARRVQQAQPGWFDPAWWGERASAVPSGGRGGAWFVDAPFGQAVLRHYLRGGLAARISRDSYTWHGADRTRSFEEFRLTRALHTLGLPVPRPIAACYLRSGFHYRASILLERLEHVHSLAHRAVTPGDAAPWEEAGRLVARIHRGGLDHADLNAHNLLFDDEGRGWVIDVDRSRVRIPETGWRESNLARLKRSLLKLRGERDARQVGAEFARLRAAYDQQWERGY